MVKSSNQGLYPPKISPNLPDLTWNIFVISSNKKTAAYPEGYAAALLFRLLSL